MGEDGPSRRSETNENYQSKKLPMSRRQVVQTITSAGVFGVGLPLGGGQTVAAPNNLSSGWSVEGFESGSLDDWNDVETAQITTSRAYAGQRSLEITDQQDDGVGNSISLPIVESAPSSVGVALLIDNGAWNTVNYKLQDSSGTDIHALNINHHRGSTQQALYYGRWDTTIRDPVNTYEWYYVELTDIQWSNNTIGEIRVDNTVEATNVPFANNGDSISNIQLRVHGSGTGSKGYFDDVSIGVPQGNTGTVTGTVTDSDGNALAVDIEFVDTGSGETEGTATTDGNGEYTIELPAATYEATANKEKYPPETATVTVTEDDTQTVDFSMAKFDPTVHGFAFENWGGAGSFTPPHNHQTIAESYYNTQFEQEWVPVLREASSIPLPGGILTPLANALYDTLTKGPRQLHSNGHCFGMCVAAQDYFETDVPDSLPANTETAADIPEPTGDYNIVGEEIDEKHRSQVLKSDILKQARYISPPSRRSEELIDAEKEVRAIRDTIKQKGSALVGIGSSPTLSPDSSFKHQVIAYDINLEGGNSVDDAHTAVINIYDPNFPAGDYDDESRQLEIAIDGYDRPRPITNNKGRGYRYLYHRFGLIGQARRDKFGEFKMTAAMVRDFILNYVKGFIGISANSPVEIDAVGPDGEQLAHPSDPVDGTPPEKICYQTNTTTGEFDIDVTGTGDGDYTLTVGGGTPDGGVIDDDVSGTVTDGETHNRRATVPDDPDGSGFVGKPDPNVSDYANNNGIVDKPGLLDALDDWRTGQIRTIFLLDVIDHWRSGDPV